MKRALALMLVACGGSSSAPQEPVEPAPQKVTRVPVETAEEEQEDGVTFVKTKGSMSKEAIEAGLAPHQEAMMECYTARVGKRKWLGGEVRLLWELKADGSIKTVKIDSNLGAWDVEKCLLDIAYSAQFDRPKGGEAEFDIPLQFSATRSTAIWDEDQALRAVGGQLAKLDECPNGPEEKKPAKPAKKAPKKAPKPKAPKGDEAEKTAERPEPRPPTNVTVTMYVGPQGKAQSIGFSSPTAEIGTKWATCAGSVANAWRLPDPKGQIAKLAIRYKPE
jgi:hypothetical protein